MNLESAIQPRDCSLTTFNLKRTSSPRLTMIASLLLTIPVLTEASAEAQVSGARALLVARRSFPGVFRSRHSGRTLCTVSLGIGDW